MLILGIESSCDETAASVVENGIVVRSSIVSSQYDLHAEFGGVVPEIASRAHAERVLPVVQAAISEAGVSRTDLEGIAVGHRPGLIGSLLVGLSAAKSLSWSLGVPLIGVDHVHAHLYAPALDEPEIEYPALGLVVSGGHTSLYRMTGPIELERLGGTIDDAIGEAFDKCAAILGLGHPGGPEIDRISHAEGANDRAFDFPVSRLSKESLDFSFSGLKTAVLYEAKGRPQPRRIPGKEKKTVSPAPEMTPQRLRDLAASFQRAAVKALLVKLDRALGVAADRGAIKSLVVGGGVSANTRVRAQLAQFAAANGLALRLPALEYCIDNAAMIAGLGTRLLESGVSHGLDLPAVPTTAC